MQINKNIVKAVKYIIVNILILAIIYLLYITHIRICPIYNLLKMPCPGCGLTTSVIYLLKGNIIMSLRYNIITIPLIVIYLICAFGYIINKKSLKESINKHKNKIIVFSIIIFIISLIINLTNPLLY